MERTVKLDEESYNWLIQMLQERYYSTVDVEELRKIMSTVGTAMKSILTRMTNIKSGKLELVDEDGTTEKLSDVETTLANVGINLRKTMTEYNSASDVLDALASKWDTLNQAQQNAIAISFGGSRMQNQFRVLMENYDRVQKYTDVAANSDGQGEQKFDLYLQGLEAKTNSLKASLESLSSSVISRDLYAGFLDGSKAVVDFTEKTGLLKGALAGLGTAGATYALSQLVSMATSATKEFSNLSNALKMVKAAESAGTFNTSNMASLINLTKGLSESQTKLVLSSTALSDAQRVAEAISEYQSWYEKAQDCKQAVIDLRNEQQKLFEQWANMPTEKAEKKIDRLTTEQANANLATTKKQKTTSDKKLAKLQKKYKNSKNLTAAQKKKIAAGKEIDTTGITDAKQLKILTAYNNALADSKKKKENVTIATDALAEANENLMTAEVESAQATVEAVSTKFDNAKTYYEALLSYQEQLSKYQEKNIDMAKAHGDYEKSSDYDVKISNTQAERAIKQNELDELMKQLNDGVEAGTIVENSQEWLDMQTKIKEAQNAVADYDTQIEELKQSQIGVYYAEQFERAAEKVDRFRDKLDGLKSLISDDMKIDKNTGLLTESGALAITLDVDDINASTENLKTYIKERQQIINDYNAGKFGEDEYNQKLKDVDANIKSTTSNIYSSRNSILELVKSQSQAELDVLNKVIDKRKEALSAKKNYYDYDKTLKNKTKDIEVLERQIAALEGSTSAEDKARKAKLQEQLQSAKDDLNDTIVDHAYSMQTDSLDKLSTDLSEDLDTWINKISSNMEEMTNAINGAISNAGLSTASTINAISSILRHYGLSDSEISQSGLTNITGYASGTDYVNKSGIYRVNEKGMESVFSKQYGTLTFLNQGDKVFDANFTKSLLDNSTIATQKNMPDYAGMAKAIEKNIQNIQNLCGNTYVNNFYIDGAQDTDSILKEIDKHLDKKIQAHDKKQVRDFKSLR